MRDNKVQIQVGKQGISNSLIEEIKLQLRKHKKVTIKMLKSAREGRDRQDIAMEVCKKTKSALVEIRGNTFTLARKDTI